MFCTFIYTKTYHRYEKILILLAIIPFFVQGQESTKPKPNKKLSIGFSFSPDYASRSLINNDGSSSSDLVIDSRNKIEKGKLSFTTSCNVNINVSKKLEFQSGLLYSGQGYRTPKREAFYSSGTPRPSEPTHVKSIVNFNYLHVPAKLIYVSGKGKINFIAGGGIAASFLLKESDVYTLFYANGSKKDVDNYNAYDHNNFNHFASASAGVEYKLANKIALRTEPVFRYGLLKIIDMPVTAKLWNIGLNMGVYCNLK